MNTSNKRAWLKRLRMRQEKWDSSDLIVLARLCVKQERHQEAEKLIMQAIRKSSASPRGNIEKTVLRIIELARIYEHQERYQEAETLLLRIKERSRGALSERIFIFHEVNYTLAWVYAQQNRW